MKDNVGYEKLSPEEYERLTILIEEIGEVLQVIGKIQKHGYEASFEGIDYDNREQLEVELGHLNFAILLLNSKGDINLENIAVNAERKNKNIWKYLNYNTEL